MRKLKMLIAFAAAALTAAGSAAAVAAAEYGWQDVGGYRKYYMKNDEYAKGVTIIDDAAYQFTEDGVFVGAYTGIGRRYGKIYYYENGYVFKNGWRKIGSGNYYFYPDGSAAVGIVTIDGVQYCFSSDGRLNVSRDSFTVASDKAAVTLGRRESITFTVRADAISGYACLGNIASLQRLRNGVWYRIRPDESFAAADELWYLGTHPEGGGYITEAALSFVPEAYKTDLTSGRYRVEIPITTQSGTVKKYCEFDLIGSAVITTPLPSYNVADTKEISFTAALNDDAIVYSEVCDIFFCNEETGAWEKVEPKKSRRIEATLRAGSRGEAVISKLDLTRYSTSSLKTGKYRAFIGEGLSCEFRLAAPFEASASQIEAKSPRHRQIIITVTNRTDKAVTLKGYGELYRREKGKWVKVKTSKKLNTEMTVSSMQRYSKSMLLTDYYPLSSLKKGQYCIKISDSSGYAVYPQFSLG